MVKRKKDDGHCPTCGRDLEGSEECVIPSCVAKQNGVELCMQCDGIIWEDDNGVCQHCAPYRGSTT
jgi:hypothetical protein